MTVLQLIWLSANKIITSVRDVGYQRTGLAKLAPQVHDMHPNRRRISYIPIASQKGKNLIRRKGLTGCRRQTPKQISLAGGQHFLLAIDRNRPAVLASTPFFHPSYVKVYEFQYMGVVYSLFLPRN